MDNPAKTQNDFIHSFARSQAIAYEKWMRSQPLTALMTVHPPAGSGGSTGIYERSDDDLYSQFLDHQKKQQEGKGE